MRQSRLIFSNAVVMWAAQILRLIPQLILVPFLIRTIGETGYGDYTLVWSLMTSIEALHRSLQSGVVKYGAAFLARDEMKKVNQVVSSSFVYSLLLGVVTCLGILLVSFFYSRSSSQLGTSLIVVSLMVLFIFPLTPFTAVIQSRQRYYIGAIAETLWKYLSLLAVFIWFKVSSPSLLSLIIIMAGLLFFSRLGQVPFAYRLVPGLRNRLKFFDRKTFLLIASFGGLTVLISASLAVNSTGVRWLMGQLISSNFVAHLAIMLMPGTLLSQIIQAITITIMPATSAYEAKGDQQALQKILKSGIRYTNIILIAGFPAAGLLMRHLLVLWVGQEYAFLTPYTLILFLGTSCMLSTSTAHQMLKGMDEQKKVLGIYIIGLILVPLGLILFIQTILGDPYIAVSLGLAMGYFLCGFFHLYFGAKVLNYNLKELLVKCYGETLLPVLIIYPIAYWLANHYQGLIATLFLSIITVIVYLSVFYFVFTTKNERKQGMDILLSIQTKLKSILT